jgi:AcrR family transcriptional regulator
MTKGEATREKILKSAVREFGAFGLHHATLEAIARKAKVQKPLIVYYFENKNQLLIASIEKVMRGFSEILGSLEHQDLSGLERIQQILDSNLMLAKKEPDSTRLIIMLYSTATWDAEFKELAMRVSEGARNRYLGILKAASREGNMKKDLDLEAASRILHQWIIGAMIDHLQAKGVPEVEKRIRDDWKTLTRSWFKT